LPKAAAIIQLKQKGSRLLIWKGITGKSALLVPGWGGNIEQLSLICRELIKMGFCVYGIDIDSESAIKSRATLPQLLTEAINDTNVIFGGKFDIAIGHSLGAFAIHSYEGRQLAKLNVLISSPLSLVGILNRHADDLKVGLKAKSHLHKLFRDSLMYKLDLCCMTSEVTSLIVHDQLDSVIPYSDAKLLHQLGCDSKLITTVNKGHLNLLNDQCTIKLVFAWLKLMYFSVDGA